MSEPKRDVAWHYLGAVAFVVLATVLRLGLNPLLGQRMPFIAFFFAVIASAWRGGPGPTILAIILSCVSATYFFLTPHHLLQVKEVDNQLSLVMFVAVCLAILIFSQANRAAQRRLLRAVKERKRAEDTVESLSARLRATLDGVGDAVILADGEGRVISLNPVAEALTGWDAAGAAGRTLREVFRSVDEATRRTAEMPVAAVVHGGETVRQTEHTDLISRDGTVRAIEYGTSPLRNDTGAISGLLLIFRDVTRRRADEKSLHESVEAQTRARAEIQRLNRDLRARVGELEALFETVPIGIAIADDVECHKVRANPAFIRMLSSDVRTETETNAEVDGVPARPFEPTPMRAAAIHGEPVVGAEVKVDLGSGRSRLLYGNASPLFDEDGAPRGAIGAFVDLTDRTRIEQEFQRREEQLRLAIEATGLGLFDWDLLTRKVLWSDRSKAIFGLSLDTPISIERLYAMIHPDDRERIETAHRLCIEPTSSGTYEAEYRVIWPDGSVRWVEARGRTLFDDQGSARRAIRFIGTVQDVTAKKDAEDQLHLAKESAESANLAKDRFLAVLSHELRTPLSPVVMALASMVTEPDMPSGMRDDLEMIRRNIDLETRLIDDLLDLSRVLNGKLPLNRQPTNVNDLVRHVLGILGGELFEKSLEVETQLAADPDLVSGDPARLQQVFWNLVKNSAKFTPEGGKVTVCTRNVGETIEIEVRDNGRGIDPAALPLIFNAFEQGDASVTHQFGGLGLGLAIALAVVDLHGGSLRAESDGPGTGASFTVTLPALAPLPRRVPGEVDSPGLPPAPPDRLRVLLVEDHADTARMLSRLLGRAGYQVRLASGVAEALNVANAEPFDVLVSDLGLPDGTGYELMEALRDRDAVQGIAMSGYGMESDLSRSRAAGFREHLVKPVDIAVLENALRRVTARAGQSG